MIPAEVNIQLDNKAIQQHVEKQLNVCIQATLWFVDVDKLVQLTSMSKRFLEQEVLCDIRFRAIEIRKSRKRFYKADLALSVLEEIMSEW